MDVVDHRAEGLALLISTFRGRPRVEGLLSSYLDEIQALENAAHEVLSGYRVDTAIGAQLDVLGRIVGQPRRGQTDETYRVFISARIAANRSDGSSDDVLRVLSLALSSPDDAWDPETTIWRIPPNTLLVIIIGYSPELASAVAELVRDSVESNVAVDILVSEDPATTFHWDIGPGWDVAAFTSNV